MDMQRFFDLGVEHIRKQGVPALYDKMCRYSTNDGLHCIAYPGLIDLGIKNLQQYEGQLATRICYEEKIHLTSTEREFLIYFQGAHDDLAKKGNFMEKLEEKLEALAIKYNLVYAPPTI